MDEKMKAIMRLMKAAFSMAQHAHDCSFNDPGTERQEDKCSALSYAAACTAKYSAAEAVYLCTPELAHLDLSELLNQFDVYTRELRSDYETGHSRQWVDIEFDRLKELFDNSACKQPITE